jgi:hypothetical protein
MCKLPALVEINPLIVMKNIILVLLLCWSGFCIAQTDEPAAVRTSFNNYKNAILNDKGEEAVLYVNEKTITYYGEMLEKVKTSDSTEVEALNLLDKLMVFVIRHRTSKQDIMSFDGKSLLVYAIKNGMVGKGSVMNNSIGDVKVDGTFAKGAFVSNGQVTPLFFDFNKENNKWKVDLTSVLPASTMAFQKMVDDSGKTENEFLFSILEMLTGRKPGAEIWVPTVKQ